MLSVLDIIKRTESYFREKGIENARLDAELLIAHALGLRRLDLYLQFDRPLEEDRLAGIRPLVKRRAEREPLQYITGRAHFLDMDLAIDRRALIPRPETEELFELACESLASPPAAVADLGTGSGALALASARRFPEARVVATDRSADALDLARENAEALGLAERIRFREGDWYEALGEAERYDLILSNPPYLTEAEMGTAQPEVAVHEPEGALAAGEDGLDALRSIIAGAAAHLNPDGILALETGIAQHDALKRLAEAAGLEGEGAEDLSGRPRLFFVRGVV